MTETFIIETTCSPQEAILAVFFRLGVGVSEVHRRRLSEIWTIIRVQTVSIGDSTRDHLIAELQRVQGVLRVTGPGEHSTLEHLLPSPYQHGPPIDDDRFFYGMDRELAELHRAFQSAAEPGSNRFVVVTGPMRVGKTSVVRRFLRSLAGESHIRLYHYPRRATWTIVAAELRDQLIRSSGHAGSATATTALQDVVEEVHRRSKMPVVIAIDEMAGVLHEMTGNNEEISAFEKFRSCVHRMAGVLVVFIAPALAVKHLAPRVANLLQDSHTVPVGSLVESDVEALLTAAKMRPSYWIRAQSSIVRNITAVTAGNPFWVASLASQMFQIERARNPQFLTYSHDTLNTAKENLLYEGRAFQDRWDSLFDRSDDLQRTAKQAILRRLANTRAGMSVGELMRAESTTSSMTLEYLDDLRLAGSVIRDRDRWKIAAPLLADYIRFLDPPATNENSLGV